MNLPESALIIGALHDEHVVAVVSALSELAVEPAVVDLAALEDDGYLLDGSDLRVGKRPAIRLTAGTRGWIRRLAPPQWRRGVLGGSQDGAIRTAWTALMVGISGDANVVWLTPLERLFLCENKLVQYRVATKLGIRAPHTVVTSDRSLIPGELSDIVVKPLGASHYASQDAHEQVVWTQPLALTAPELDLLAGAPFILQQRLHAERHLRVVTVRRRAWVHELHAAGVQLDWRLTEEAHHSFAAVDEPEVAQQALRLADEIGVGYSSQDWIVARGEAYFIDLNPAGQWLFLPEPRQAEITGSIACWLAGARE